jgi:hypothetical protein
MKKYLWTFFLMILIIQVSFGQIVESSCEAPDSIVEKYQDDAAVLTLRKFYENDLPWVDSIEIPQEHIDTALNALIAVWNAYELPARDTVVDMLEIDAALDYAVNHIIIKCDTSVHWMNQIIDGNALSGNYTVDSLLNLYNLEYLSNSVVGSNNYVYFTSEICYNMPQLSTQFEGISGVISVFAQAGNTSAQIHENIEMAIHSDYVLLHYLFGWEDCPSGCLNWRFWQFRVYYDCSVEYVGSYGNVLPPLYNVNNINLSGKIEIFPNPANNYVKIKGIGDQNIPFVYSFYNSSGVKVMSGKATDTQIELNGKLNNGLYILEIHANNKIIRKKIQIIKN